MNRYWAPTKPYSAEDAVARVAAATGSVGYAAQSHLADFNGHSMTLCWNAYRGYYVCEYAWAGRNVVARGDFVRVLEAAVAEYARQGRGAQLTVNPREDDEAAIQACENHPALQPYSEEAKAAWDATWRTWKHDRVGEAVMWERCRSGAIRALLAAESEADWETYLQPRSA